MPTALSSSQKQIMAQPFESLSQDLLDFCPVYFLNPLEQLTIMPATSALTFLSRTFSLIPYFHHCWLTSMKSLLLAFYHFCVLG